MYWDGQIVVDVENLQLVMYMGLYGAGKDCKLVVPFMTEERVKNTGKKVSLEEDCLINLKTTHIVFPDTKEVRYFNNFDKIKKAIAEAGVVYANYGERGNNGVWKCLGRYEIRVGDDKNVIIKEVTHDESNTTGT